MGSESILFASNPTPPFQKAVGFPPQQFIRLLPLAPSCKLPFPINQKWSRDQVAQVCRNHSIPLEIAYACAMAWGGQRRDHFSKSVAGSNSKFNPNLFKALLNLRNSNQSRKDDFNHLQAASKNIPGLGISFFTKLLYFFRPKQDAYILDKWTARGIVLISFPSRVRLAHKGVGPEGTTTPDEYEWYCSECDYWATKLWQNYKATGSDFETALFDLPRGQGFWREFVRANFLVNKKKVSLQCDLLCQGAESLTESIDYFCRFLVLRHKNKIYLISLLDSRQSSFNNHFLRLVLGKLYELHNKYQNDQLIFVVPGLKKGLKEPKWFTDGMKVLNGIVLKTSIVGNDEAPFEDDELMSEAASNMSGQYFVRPKKTIFLNSSPENYIGIVADCNEKSRSRNLGLICKRHGHIFLKEGEVHGRNLVAEIKECRGNFETEPTYKTEYNKSTCCGGVGYRGCIELHNVSNAIKYLKTYFNVLKCSLHSESEP